MQTTACQYLLDILQDEETSRFKKMQHPLTQDPTLLEEANRQVSLAFANSLSSVHNHLASSLPPQGAGIEITGVLGNSFQMLDAESDENINQAMTSNIPPHLRDVGAFLLGCHADILFELEMTKAYDENLVLAPGNPLASILLDLNDSRIFDRNPLKTERVAKQLSYTQESEELSLCVIFKHTFSLKENSRAQATKHFLYTIRVSLGAYPQPTFTCDLPQALSSEALAELLPPPEQ